MLDRSRSRDRSKTGGAFSPAGLFVTGAQGAWYDPSDFSTLFQNAAGTTPVTAVEQPVRLMLDRSRGLVLGGELVTDGSFAGGTVPAGWTGTSSATLSVVAGELVINTAAGSGFPGGRCTVTTVVGRTYRLILTARETATNNCSVYIADSGGNFVTSAPLIGATNTQFDFYFVARQTSTFIDVFEFIGGAGTGTIIVDNISVRELPGNHALAPNDASRPVLRARYNQITFSEQFDNAVWTKTNATVTSGVADPFGGTKAFTLTATSNNGDILQSVSNPGGTAASITQAIWVRRRTGTGTVSLFNLNAGGITTITVTSSWQLFSVTGPGAASLAYAGLRLATSGDAVDIAFASLLTSADQTSTGGAYQRIAAATDYDVSNPVFRPYLAFDGSDDHMVLASAINITTDMTVVRGFGRSAAGITSLGMGRADATVRHDLFWFGFNSTRYTALGDVQGNWAASTSTGSFVSTTARNATEEKLRLNGTAVSSAKSPGAVSSGFTAVGRYDVNYNNGPIYGLIVLDRELTGSELTASEQWMAGKTGVNLP